MLRAAGIEFSYNGKKVLDGINFEIGRGEFVGILGPNGAGKSTLLRVLCGILAPRAGSVDLEGRALQSVPARDLARRIAVLPAETFYPYDFSVEEIVKMGRAPHLPFWSEGGRADLRIVQDALAAVGIEPLARRRIHSLSSGERQMAFLAQALAQEPDLLMLDEPTVHLDIQHQIQIFRNLEAWNRERRMTILVISHDLNIASQFAGRLLLMREGRIAAQGEPREVITEENIEKVYGIRTRVALSPKGRPALIFD